MILNRRPLSAVWFNFRTRLAAMPRLTLKGLADENKLLRNEIVQLEAQLHSREERSRSRHRKAQFKVEPISARTMRALDIVCKHDRDSVIEEQRATIAKQAQVNENLRLGGGLVKPVLCAAFNYDEQTSATIRTRETTREYIMRLYTKSNELTTGLMFGKTSV